MLVRERHSDSSDDPSGPDGGPRRRAARRGVVGALSGALVMLVAATALAVTGQDMGVLGLSDQQREADPVPGAPAAPAEAPGPPPLTSAPGRCLSWSSDDASDVREVDCAAPHLFEIAGPVTAPQPPGAPFPATEAWQQLVTDQCTPLARTYLSGELDPAGRYRAGALQPTQAAWAAGERTVRCGLQAPGRTGALFPSTGRVADRDQAVVFDAGTCLGLAGKEVSDPVGCGGTHAAEVAGTVDLGRQFPDSFPSVDDQDNYLQPTCAKVAQDHVGGQQKLADSKLTVYWTNLSQESWDAGTRRVDCNLGALLADGSGFAPLTGTAAEGVTIGDEAPPSTPAARPGTPADVPGSGAATAGGSGPASPAPSAPGGAAPAPVRPSPVLPAPVPSLPVGIPGN